MYVDDIVTKGDTIEQISKIKNEATEKFSKGGFKLHKWHSNDFSLETTPIQMIMRSIIQEINLEPNQMKLRSHG